MELRVSMQQEQGGEHDRGEGNYIIRELVKNIFIRQNFRKYGMNGW